MLKLPISPFLDGMECNSALYLFSAAYSPHYEFLPVNPLDVSS